MKIGIVSSIVPHINGGGRFIVDWLEPHLRAAGHQVERVLIPTTGDPNLLLSQMVALRTMDLDENFDRIITLRPPAHVVRHRCKVVWFIHHERVFYDLWNSEYNSLNKDFYWNSVRKNLFHGDTKALSEAHLLFSNSAIVRDRVRHFNGLNPEVLYPPVINPERFFPESYNGEILFTCRVEHHKRQHLAIEAMRYVKTPVRLRMAGLAANPAYKDKIISEIMHHNLSEKVTFDCRWITEGEKCHLINNALANIYIPLDEDSYGYPTLEAAHASKATITASDAGGVSEFVQHGINGFIVEPDAHAVAACFDELWLDRQKAQKMGQEAYQRIRELNVDWAHTVESLTR